MAQKNDPATPVRPGGTEGPIYPRLTREEGDYFATEDWSVFIESCTWPDPLQPHAPEIIYVSFIRHERWKMWGDCFSCGIADANMPGSGGWNFGDYNIIDVPNTRLGEKFSVVDLDYSTRRDYPCMPGYVEAGQAMAISLGVPYVCGLQFERLRWITRK